MLQLDESEHPRGGKQRNLNVKTARPKTAEDTRTSGKTRREPAVINHRVAVRYAKEPQRDPKFCAKVALIEAEKQRKLVACDRGHEETARQLAPGLAV